MVVPKNRSKPKEAKNDLTLLCLNSDKANESKNFLKKDGIIQFEALQNTNRFYS